jgi:hypothetical protein
MQADLARETGANMEMTYVSWSFNTSDLFHRIQVRAQSSMNNEYLFVDDCCKWQVIKAINKNFPYGHIISPLTLFIETTQPSLRGSFMAATQKEKVLGILYLIG